MKVAVYPGGGKPWTIESAADPEPGPEDVVIKVHRCGICGTDLHMTEGHVWQFPAGTVPGHEYSGEVVEVGSAVTQLKKGDRITALPSTGCGHCLGCFSGNLTMCKNAPGLMGGFGEYLRIPTAYATKLPDTLTLADGALIEPLAIALYGNRLAQIQPGDRVLVQGAGSVALCVIYWARRLGAGRIVAVSRSDRRAAMAIEMGASAFVQSSDNEVAEVAEALGGPPDLVFECVGQPGFLGKAMQHVRVLGKVMSMGFCTSPDPILPAIGGSKGITLQFPVGYSLKDFQYVADVMDKGHVDPKMLISSVVPFADLPATIERLRGPHEETKVQVSLAVV